jgi:hypothetical protein
MQNAGEYTIKSCSKVFIHSNKVVTKLPTMSESGSQFQQQKQGIPRDTHNKRQATQHGCLPSLLGDGDKGIEIVYGKEKNILYWAD